MIKGSILKKDKTIINAHAFNKRVSRHMKQLSTELREEITIPTRTSLFSTIDKITRLKNQ